MVCFVSIIYSVDVSCFDVIVNGADPPPLPVVITITPLAAFEPYNAVAEASFNTLTLFTLLWSI